MLIAPSNRSFVRLTIVSGSLTLLALVGCSREEPIRVYTVKHHEPDRMLGAVIERPGDLWFFKVTGPAAEVEPLLAPVKEFIQSIRFPSLEAPPEWKLPDGWIQKPGEGLRFATIKIPTRGKSLEMSITTLARPPLPEDGSRPGDFGLENLNRWRNQLMLPGMSRDQIPTQTEPLTYEGAIGYFAHWAGTSRPPRAGMPALAADRATPRPQAPPRAASPAPNAKPIKFTLPEGWREAKNDTISQYAFEVADGGQQARITISQLGPGAGGLAANVNRWRDQLGLPRFADEKELEAAIEPIDVGGVAGRLVELNSPDGATNARSILGVIVSQPAATWFIKLVGDRAVATREREHFREFVGSLKLDGGGEPDGD